MIGKIIINANGEKAISFDDAAWVALPVGATIYAAGNGEVDREALKSVGRASLGAVVEGLACAVARHLATEAAGVFEKGLVEEIERLSTDLATLEQACKEALPGVYYMDPPDGGDVSLGEQVLRMGKDAARYRTQKPVKLPPTEYFGDSWSGGWAITHENIVDCLEEHGVKVEDE